MRLVFGMAGIGTSVWAIIIPAAKIRFQLDDATLGAILFIGGTGGLLAMPLAGVAIARWGSRRVLSMTGVGVAGLLPALTLVPNTLGFTVCLFLYGWVFGMLETSMNAQGAVVERRSGRLRMSGFHACFSLGGLGVALASAGLLRLGLTPAGCAGVSAAVILLILTQTGQLIGKAGDTRPEGRHWAWPNRAALVLGACCFACFMTEGAATDWSTIFLHFSRGLSFAAATLGYAAFAVSMTIARLFGDAVATRLGQPWLMRLGTLLALLGFGLIIFVPRGAVDVLGFGLVGLGTGNIIPLVFSAAARVPGMQAHQAVPVVVGLGYAGFLVGPVMIGLVANHLGLGTALGVDAALLAATLLAARAVA